MPLFGPKTSGPGTVRVRWCGYVKKNGSLTTGNDMLNLKDKAGNKIIVKTPDEAKAVFLKNRAQLIDATDKNIFSNSDYTIGSIVYTESSVKGTYYYAISLNSDIDDHCRSGGRRSRKPRKSKRHIKSRKHRKTRRH